MANRWLLTVAALFCAATLSRAQHWSVQTNLVDYMNYGTMNVEGAMAISRHWSALASYKLNPFSYEKNGEPLKARQQLVSAGVRYWPWHVFSGWWTGTRLQYQQYSRGGIEKPETGEGDRYGLGVSGGYSYMLTPHINLDFGAGIWAGVDNFITYSCPVCGVKIDEGKRGFFLPSDLLIALVYVF